MFTLRLTDSRNTLEAFFYGRAFAQAISDRVNDAVADTIADLGILQAEAQKGDAIEKVRLPADFALPSRCQWSVKVGQLSCGGSTSQPHHSQSVFGCNKHPASQQLGLGKPMVTDTLT